MKRAKPRRDLIYTLGPALIVLSFIIVFRFPKELLYAYRIYWLLLVFAIILIITRWGNYRIQSTDYVKPYYPFFPWLTRIFTIELCLCAIFYSITQLINQSLPVLISKHPDAFMKTMQNNLITLGLFPWAGIAVVTVAMGYVSYCKNQDAYMHNVLMPIIKSSPRKIFGMNVNVDTKLATIYALSSTLAFISLSIANAFAYHTLPIVIGLHLSTTLIILFLILFAFTKPFFLFLKQMISAKYPLFIGILLLNLSIAATVLLLNWLFVSLEQIVFQLPWLVKFFQEKGWRTLWMIFSLSWWISWTPVVSANIARISRGYSIRQVVIGILLLPSIATGILLFTTPDEIALWNDPILDTLIGLVGFVGLFYFIAQKQALSALITSYLPKGGRYKHRDYHFYFRKCTQLTAMIIYFYLPTGLAGTTMFLFTFSLPFAVIILFILVALVKMLWQAKIQSLSR